MIWIIYEKIHEIKQRIRVLPLNTINVNTWQPYLQLSLDAKTLVQTTTNGHMKRRRQKRSSPNKGNSAEICVCGVRDHGHFCDCHTAVDSWQMSWCEALVCSRRTLSGESPLQAESNNPAASSITWFTHSYWLQLVGSMWQASVCI